MEKLEIKTHVYASVECTYRFLKQENAIQVREKKIERPTFFSPDTTRSFINLTREIIKAVKYCDRPINLEVNARGIPEGTDDHHNTSENNK